MLLGDRGRILDCRRAIMPLKDMTKEQLHGFLDPNDPVAISFWIISIAMVAATVFFLMEALCVSTHWKTSMHVGALVSLVAAVHYFYMREFWVQIGSSPILYRYIDWTITVPLQIGSSPILYRYIDWTITV